MLQKHSLAYLSFIHFPLILFNFICRKYRVFIIRAPLPTPTPFRKIWWYAPVLWIRIIRAWTTTVSMFPFPWFSVLSFVFFLYFNVFFFNFIVFLLRVNFLSVLFTVPALLLIFVAIINCRPFRFRIRAIQSLIKCHVSSCQVFIWGN